MELDTTKTSIQIDDTNELFIEPTVAITDDKSDPISLTTAERFAGILYTLLSSFLFTVSIFITKQLGVELLDALVFRFVLQTIILIIYMKFIKNYSLYTNSTNQERWMLFVNVFFSITAFLSFFIGYRYLPLPDLTTIRYTQVIWTAIIVAVMYREKPSIAIILAILLTTVGVVFVAQPNFLFYKSSDAIKKSSSNDDQRLTGLIIAIFSSVAMTLMVISNKILHLKYHVKHSIIVFQFTSVFLVIVICHLFYKFYFITDRFELFKIEYLNWRYFCASFACLAQIFASILVQKAVKREHPSIFTIAQSSDILFSILLQNLFSSIKSNLLSLFGSVLVLSSILIISGEKLIKEKNIKQNTEHK